jgi:hypothetical protein
LAPRAPLPGRPVVDFRVATRALARCVVDFFLPTRVRIQTSRRFTASGSLDRRMRHRFQTANTVDFLDARSICALNPEEMKSFRSI